MSQIDSIKQLLRSKTGVLAETLGPEAVERAVDERCEALGILDIGRYSLELLTHKSEMNHLVDAIVVPESWFFRDVKPFEFLARRIATLTPSKEKPFRALSAPCAAGEEPYSVAMTFLDAGWDPMTFRIDGIDISHELTSQAGHVPFGPLSFRGTDLAFRDRYFQTLPNGHYELQSRLQETVTFRQANLSAPDFLIQESPYDAIFCRNVLIYLDDASRQQALKRLDALLAPGGVLFVGHVEGGPMVAEHFDPLPDPGVFAYAKRNPRPSRSRVSLGTRQGVARRTHQRRQTAKPVATNRLTNSGRGNTALPTNPTRTQDADLLARAERHANLGQLPQARDLCQQYLKFHGPSAKAYFLLGMIEMDSNSSETAKATLEKAIYLDPNHTEALTHLILHARSAGDDRSAERYQRQLDRVQRQLPQTS